MASGSNVEDESSSSSSSQTGLIKDDPVMQKWESEKGNGFDCNICLDSANEPVITLCGHLYCWPCIYKWLHVQTSSSDHLVEPPKCPVCKSNISESSLVPLYGRGTSSPNFDRKRSQADQIIPGRPQAIGTTQGLITAAPVPDQSRHQQFYHHHHHQEYLPHPYGQLASMGPSDFRPPAMASSIFSPTVGMFREMVLTRIFGGLDHVSMLAYHHPNSVVLGTPSPRMRRHEMQLDKSLNRVSIFMFCCFILCLLLF